MAAMGCVSSLFATTPLSLSLPYCH